MNNPKKTFHPVLWVITNFIAMGIPFSMVIWVTGTLFKDLGHSDTEITVATGSVGIVWSLKPLWAGFLDMFKTKKFFVAVDGVRDRRAVRADGPRAQPAGYFGAIIALLVVRRHRLGDAGHLLRRHLHLHAEQGATSGLHRRAGHGLERRAHHRRLRRGVARRLPARQPGSSAKDGLDVRAICRPAR